ncbi:sushi, von Willebrand factor type A, EGF and pentraxin domain-containing protein 1-like, partial [Sycon ciliatum]|uniref:sushi, von Willebrand factor type A, EGF and pentraxin domain-containing protein 1-like n=1 Tax=Sycon ciliatum TaxID=27933 RepID=UPI0031F70716
MVIARLMQRSVFRLLVLCALLVPHLLPSPSRHGTSVSAATTSVFPSTLSPTDASPSTDTTASILAPSSLPVCEVPTSIVKNNISYGCPAPTVPNGAAACRGSLPNGFYHHGLTVNISCSAGFDLEDSDDDVDESGSGSGDDVLDPSITCSQGSWSPLPACVRLHCLSPPTLNFTFVPVAVASNASFSVGDVVSLSCANQSQALAARLEAQGTGGDDGGEWRFVQSLHHCIRRPRQHAEWTPAEVVTMPGHYVTECRAVCRYPMPLPRFAYFPSHPDLSASFPESTIITGACHYGYRLSAGNFSLQCRADGNFRTDPFRCSPLTCTLPPDITNGNYSFIGQCGYGSFAGQYAYGSSPAPGSVSVFTQVKYSCDVGSYTISGASNVAECSPANGSVAEWINVPTCEPLNCTEPPSLENAHIVFQLTDAYHLPIVYHCNPGFSFKSGRDTVESRCVYPNYTWHGLPDDGTGPPVCMPSNCTDFPPDDGTFAVTGNGTGATYPVGSSVRVACVSSSLEFSHLRFQHPYVNSINAQCVPTGTGAAVAWTTFVSANPSVCVPVQCEVNHSLLHLEALSFGATEQPLRCKAGHTPSPCFAHSHNHSCFWDYQGSSAQRHQLSPALCSPKPCIVDAQFCAANSSSVSPGGSIVATRNSSALGSEGVLVCHPGFIGGGSKWSCAQDTSVVNHPYAGVWQTTATTGLCQPVTCAPPSLSTNEVISPVLPQYPYLVVLVYSCSEGYRLRSGNATATCSGDGSFDGEHPACQIVQCPLLPTPTNGILSASRGMFSQTLTLTCNRGYRFSDGRDITSFTCMANGSYSLWSLPACNVQAQCPPLPANLSFASLSSSSATYQDTVKIECLSGYVGEGGTLSSDYTCTDVSTATTRPVVYNWTFAGTGTDLRSAGCSPVTCLPPSSPPGSAVVGQTPAVIRYGDVHSLRCLSGYEPTGGDLVRSCVVDVSNNGVGMLTGSVPVCSPIQCTDPGIPVDGQRNTTAHSYTDVIQYECNSGFLLNGTSIIQCQANATWTAPTPHCTVVNCDHPGHSDYISRHGDEHFYNRSVMFHCPVGFDLVGNSVLFCQADGSWNGSTPRCVPKHCTAPDNTNAFRSSTTNYTVGSAIRFQCYFGYETADDVNVLCQHNQTWNSSFPTCTKISCGQPPAGQHVSLHNSSSDYLAVAHYICLIGYAHSSGDSQVVCQANGSWSGMAMRCAIVTCPPLLPPQNGTASNVSSFVFGSTVAFACDPGFVLNGSRSRTCGTSGQWDGHAARCEAIVCVTPSLPAHTLWALSNSAAGSAVVTFVNSYLPSTLPYLSTLSYSCSAGYALSGSSTQTCDLWGQWDHNEPTCSAISCPDPGSVANAARHVTGFTYRHNVRYQCLPGFYGNGGESVITCTRHGNWSAAPLSCQAYECTANITVPKFAIVVTSDGNDYVPGQVLYENGVILSLCVLDYNVTNNTSSVSVCRNGELVPPFQPTCEQPQCPGERPPGGNNTLFSGAGNHSGDTYEFWCRDGYTWTWGAARLNVTCRRDSQWSMLVPHCFPAQCPQLAPLSNGAWSNVSGVFEDDVTGVCNQGYEQQPSNASATVTCQANQTWSPAQLTCEKIECSMLYSPANGSLALSDGVRFESRAVFTCDAGFSFDGLAFVNLMCQANGTWSGPAPACTRVTCSFPPPPTYPGSSSSMAVSSANVSFDFSSMYAYTCAAGFYLTGAASVMCTQQGRWSAMPPSCHPVTCSLSTLPSLTNGSHDRANTTADLPYGQAVTWSCDEGFSLHSGDSALYCVHTTNQRGYFNGTLPSCRRVQCPDITNLMSAFVLPRTSNYAFGDTATVRCFPNHELMGGSDDIMITCLSTGLWSSDVTACTIIKCGTIPSVPFADRQGNLSTYGSSVVYSCLPGYNMTAGSAMISCQDDKTWSGTVPTCTRITCLAPPPLSSESLVTPMLSVYDWNTTVEYSCQVGYLLTTPSITHAQCDSDGLFTVEHPGCHIVRCPALAQDNAAFSSARGSYGHNITMTCSVGYELQPAGVHAINFTCLASGSYSTFPLPACKPIRCVALGSVSNASVANTSAGYLSRVRVKCDAGFVAADGTLSGEYACSLDSTAASGVRTYRWTPTGFDLVSAGCKPVECLQPSPVGHFRFDPRIVFPIAFGSTISGSCDLGHELAGGDLVRSCVVDVSNNGVAMNCDHPGHSDYISRHGDEHFYNRSVMFHCPVGFDLVGNSVLFCQADGSWNSSTPSCVPKQCPMVDNSNAHRSSTSRNSTVTIVQCPVPSLPTHTLRSPNVSALTSLDYTATILYSCPTGYRLVGNATQVCQETGDWSSPVTPYCSIVTCPDPGQVANGVRHGSTFHYQSMVTYQCTFGYQLRTDLPVLVCLANGSWSQALPVCEDAVKACNTDIPAPANALYTFTTQGRFRRNITLRHGAVILTECALGAFSNTSLRSVCTYGEWQPPFEPNCQPVDCGPAPRGNNTVQRGSGTSYGSVQSYYCLAGHASASGTHTLQCQENGYWSDKPLHCEVIRCPPLPPLLNGYYTNNGTGFYGERTYPGCDSGYELVANVPNGFQ